jgi:hypothetical protein
MTHENFPALFQNSDKSALDGQNKYLNYFLWGQITLVVGAAISLVPFDSSSYGHELAISSTVCFIAAIAITIAIKYFNLENRWYNGRAVAESIKSLTWKYVTKVEPFIASKSVGEVDKEFCEKLQELLKENIEYLDNNFLIQSFEQISVKMREIRNGNFDSRKAIYN